MALRYLIYLALFLPPLLGFFAIWPLKSAAPDGATILVSLCLAAAGLIATRDNYLHLPGTAIPLGLVLLSTGISGLLADYSSPAIWYWQLITLTALMLALIGLGRLRWDLDDDGYTRALARGLLVMGVIYALGSLLQYYGVLAWIFGIDRPRVDRLAGLWAQPNLTTNTLWLSLFAAVYLAEKTGRSAALYICVFLFGVVCALAASRSNVLFLPWALLLAGIFWRSSSPQQRQQGRLLAQSSAVFLACLLLVPPLAHWTSQQLGFREGSTAGLMERKASDRPRIIEHQRILTALPDLTTGEIATGVGPGNYGHFSFQLPVIPKRDAGGQAGTFHSHNLFSMLFVEQGVLGLGVAVGIVAFLIKRLWQIRRQPHSLAIAGPVGILFLHSNVAYPLWYPWFSLVLVALALPLFRDFHARINSSRLLLATGVLLIAVTAGIGGKLLAQTWQIFDVALAREPGQKHYRQIQQIEHDGLLGPYATVLKYRTFPPGSNRLEPQLRKARQMAAWRPLDVVKVRQVTLLMMAGHSEAACREAMLTTQHYPAAGPVMVEKANRISRTLDLDAAAITGCVRQGFRTWDVDLATMKQRNQESIQQRGKTDR